MKVTILQPNYIPWRGYFDFFKQSDVFVFYDDVQYTRHDWRNRNVIKTPVGPLWLTVPVESKGCIQNNLLIKDAKICDYRWIKKHLGSMVASYKKAPYFDEVYPLIRECIEKRQKYLVDLNTCLMRLILYYIGIKCTVRTASEFNVKCEDKTGRLIKILHAVGATEYLTGPAAKGYLDESQFTDIGLVWHDYKPKEYPQLWGEYIPNLSIVDTLFNCGPKTRDII
jgi:hypothetical protein